MNRVCKLFLVITLLGQGIHFAHAVCGPMNYGALPNSGYDYCVGSQTQRYDRCGNLAGLLTGLKDHPLMCESTWSNLNLTTIQICENEKVTQCATRGTTTRCRDVYSRNKGWIWSPAANTVPQGEVFEQESNCGNTRQAVGTQDHNCSTSDWSPARNTVCWGEEFEQQNSCGGTRDITGSMTTTDWTPLRSSVCRTVPLTQHRTCGTSKTTTGSKNCSDDGSIDGEGDDTQHARWTWQVTAQGDEGYFRDSATGANNNATVLYNDNRNTIIRRFTSPAGHPYRLWIDDNRTAGFGVNLKDRTKFDAWLYYMEEEKTPGVEYHPNRHWCEFVENHWTPWTITNNPPDCGVVTIEEERQCDTVQGATKPCVAACQNGATQQTQTRSRTEDRGDCCTSTTWGPPRNGVCDTQDMLQVSNCGAERTVKGTKDCSSCTDTTWSPDVANVCSTESVLQTSNCNRTRGVNGERNCGCADTNWSPDASGFCTDTMVDQTSNCGTTQRVPGTKVCGLPAPACGSLHGQKFQVSRWTEMNSIIHSFNAAQPIEKCAVGINVVQPYGDGSGVDRLIFWECGQSGHANKICLARVTCDNLGSSSCTFDIN